MKWINADLLKQGFNGLTKRDLLLVCVFSLLAGHYLVSHQEPEYFWELWMLSDYYPAMLGSTLIAFSVAMTICYINSCLNVVQPWISKFARRFVLQVVYGILFPTIIMLLLVSFYFLMRGETVKTVAYFRLDFGVSVVFIAFLNLFYLAVYFYQKAVMYYQKDAEQDEDFTEVEAEAELSSGMGGIAISAFLGAAYFYHIDRVNLAVSIDGNSAPTGLLMAQLEEGLPKQQFFRVQNGVIINKSAILLTEKASSHRMLVYLNTPFRKGLNYVEINGKKINCFIVPQRKVTDFKNWNNQ